MDWAHLILLGCAVGSCVASATNCNFSYDEAQFNLHTPRRYGELKPGLVLEGPIYQTGDYRGCVYEESKKYCLAEVEMKPLNEYSALWKRIKETNSLHTNFRRDLLYVGLCVPRHCENEDICQGFARHLNSTAKTLGVTVNVSVGHGQCTSKEKKPLRTLDHVTSSILAAILIFVLWGTIYDSARRLKNKTVATTTYGRFLLCFSIPENWKRLVTVRDSEDSKCFGCIQGIRSISMYLVVAGHVLYAAINRPLKNPQFIEESYHDFFRSSLCNGQATMSTFFCISGFLLSYFFLKEADARGAITPLDVLKAICHRYMRLTPVYAIVILLQATWIDRIGSGPVWPTMVSEESENCRWYGWTNLLYINNIVHQRTPCLIHTWYLAADFQCYVLSMLLLVLVWKYQRYSKQILFGALLLWIVVPFVQTFIWKLDPVIMNTPENVKHFPMDKTFNSTYITFHGNAGAYTVGVIFGYFYNYAKHNRSKLTLGMYILIWTINLTVPWAILVLPFIFYQPGYTYNALVASVFASVSKVIYAAGIGTIVTSFALGYGGIGNTIASWKPFQIFGRLSYTVYLIHPTILRAEAGAAKDPLYISVYVVFESWLSNVITSTLLALFFCLLIELPTSALTKLVSQNGQRVEEKKTEKGSTRHKRPDVDSATNETLLEDRV